MSSQYGERSARSNVKMSKNNVKSSACHIKRFVRERVQYKRTARGEGCMHAKSLCHGKVHWVLGKEDGILWIKGTFEHKGPQVIVRGSFMIENGPFAK